MNCMAKNRSNVIQLQLIKCERLLVWCTNKLQQLFWACFSFLTLCNMQIFNSEYLSTAHSNSKYGKPLSIPVSSMALFHCFYYSKAQVNASICGPFPSFESMFSSTILSHSTPQGLSVSVHSD